MQELMEREDEPLAPAGERDAMAIATTRAAEEVKAAMVIAQKFPRDENKALARIVRACQRTGLAEVSQYEYNRGGAPVTGPSIRLAEALAQAWGNLDYGIVELAQDEESSEVQSYCHDLESNVRQVKVFTVPHVRHTKKGAYRLTDPRDIYEMVANQGARRLRACILGVIPGDIVDRAVDECNKTLQGKSDKLLVDRVREMVVAFDGIGVKAEDLERKLGHKLDACTVTEVVRLGKTFAAIREGFTTASAEFPPAPDQANEELKAKVTESLAKNGTKVAPAEVINPTTGEVTPAEPLPQSRQASMREELLAEYLDICEAKGLKVRSVTGKSIEAIRGFIAEAKEMQAK